jgi:hypothetical protein
LPPRACRHPREPLRAIHVISWLLSPLQLKVLQQPALSRRGFTRPRDLPETSRSRRKRRARRLRALRLARLALFCRRAAWTLGILAALTLIGFWAKFAVVYGLPDFLKTGPLAHARAYVVFKSWWFGPPSFNLQDYAQTGTGGSLAALEEGLQRYQDIVGDPGEIVYVWSQAPRV